MDEEEGRGWSSSLAFAKKWVTGVEKAADKPWRELLPETLQPFAPLVARVVMIGGAAATGGSVRTRGGPARSC